ncbi:unnamed protein product, partial [marine sediment metagenome]
MVDDFRFVPILIPRQEEAKRFITLVSNVLGRFQFSLNVSYKDKAGYNYTLPDQISFEIEFVKNRQSVKPNPKIRTVTLASSPSIRSTLFEDIEKKINEVLTSSKIQLNSYFGDSTFSLRVYAFIPKVFYQIGRVLYLFPGSFLETKKFNISIYPNQPKIEIKTTYEPIAATEKRFSIAIEAKNTGIGIARDLIFNLDFQDG